MRSRNRHRKLLSKKFRKVLKQIVPETLLPYLVESGMLATEEAETVEATNGGMTARARKLLYLVDRKPDKFRVFIQCLRDANHEDVADLLEAEEESSAQAYNPTGCAGSSSVQNPSGAAMPVPPANQPVSPATKTHQGREQTTRPESFSVPSTDKQPSRTTQTYTPTERAGPSSVKNPSGVSTLAPIVHLTVPPTTKTHQERQLTTRQKRSHSVPSADILDGMSLSERSQLKYMPPSGQDSEDGHSASEHSGKTTPTHESGTHLERVQEVSSDLQELLRREKDRNNSKCLDTWSSAATSLGSKASLPSYTIGVMGESGHGKSNLLNALLDHTDLLPTSGMKACTSVVIEVGNNGSQSMYGARIEFLSQEKWEKELELSWETMHTESGDFCNTKPERKNSPDAYVAWCKIRAVYGDFSSSTTLEDLKKPNEVTKNLGKTIDIVEREVDTFCDRIDQYIKESVDHGNGGEFWPVVTKVSIRIPGCKVCRDGIVLVDLPGSRDSNAARDMIAQENMKKLSHVLFVVDITRALSNETTTKDLLGEHFRRQMLMDGQYRNISVVCTKSDNIGKRSEIERELKDKQKDLPGKLQPGKTVIKNLTDEKSVMENKRKAKEAELKELKKKEKQQCSDIVKRRKTTELELKRINEKISELSTKIKKENLSLDLICTKARINFVYEKIREDFYSGIEEMKLQAGDETEIDVVQIAQKLEIFCVSSTDYQKLTMDEGEPRVFKDTADTEIPKLQEFLQKLGQEPRRRRAEQLLPSLHQLLSDIKGHLSDSGTKELWPRIESELLDMFFEGLQQLIHKFSNNLQSLFDVLLSKLEKGVENGKAQAPDICKSWRRRFEKKKHRTYKAVCRRNGVFKSNPGGYINFNDELARPLLAKSSIAWNNVLNVKLGSLLDEFIVNMNVQINDFITRLENEFPEEVSRLGQLKEQVALTAENKMAYHMDEVKHHVEKQQRDIHRQISPIIQKELRQTYSTAGEEKGHGSFDSMTDIVETGVKLAASRMYDEAATYVKNELIRLQTDVVQRLANYVESLRDELQGMYEPLQESPANITVLKTRLGKDVDSLLARVQVMCKEANVNLGQQRTVTQMTPDSQPRKRGPSTSQGPPESQGPPKKIKPGNRHCFPGNNDCNPNGQ